MGKEDVPGKNLGSAVNSIGKKTEEDKKNIENAKFAMLEIFRKVGELNLGLEEYPEDDLVNSVKEIFEHMILVDQEEVATYFFNETIGKDIKNMNSAYKVYEIFPKTFFGFKFMELENNRLQKESL